MSAAELLNPTRGTRYTTLHDAEQTLKRLLGPADLELRCDECFEKLDEHVELQLGGAVADDQIPGMRAHLEGCSACHEDYDGLRGLVQEGEPNN